MEIPDRLQKKDNMDEVLQISASEKQIHENCPFHGHEFYELEYILSGIGIYEMNGEKIRFSAGSVFVMTPVDIHAVKVYGEITVINIMFSERWLDESIIFSLIHAKGGVAVKLPALRRECFVNLCRNIITECQKDALFRERALKNMLECAIITVLRETDAIETKHPGLSDMQRAILYIQNNFRKSITLADVAAQACLSRTYFSEKFHDYVGMPYQKYLISLRCTYAQRLLTYTDIAVTEICHASGFSSLSHFQRTFKSLYGVSPGGWRKSARNNILKKRHG